ncbi:major facilitator superfamily domain-containing protein [Mycena rosella]|uniref:Major facilitator superfamily domain-containing protein n=1 Tax=Mycena rosella TaxID=1033263 RepID=A0AAD7GJZ4_MYCRO|nr:major facilitator superfamily domain-containing protein [Mycena rosella]
MLVQITEPLASHEVPCWRAGYRCHWRSGRVRERVGYYASIESLFFLTEALTVLHWSRASDRFGRKAILLIGLSGTALSMLCFGLSRTFWRLVVSRCLMGVLNGNFGVIESAIADMRDPSNRAQGFAYVLVAWDAGAALGPLVGGLLARPHDNFPRLFRGKFWNELPYFLPCLVTSGFVFLTFFVVFALFTEVHSPTHTRMRSGRRLSREPLPVRNLLSFPVLISLANYVTLSFLHIALSALLPLFLAMPIAHGGLGLPPATIGQILSLNSVPTALFQVFFSARLIQHFGAARVFVAGLAACVPSFTLLPLMSCVAQHKGLTSVVWALLGVVLALGALLGTSFGAIFMFVAPAAPTSSRGTVNGLTQTAVSSAKALAPALATSLFSLSVERNLLGGYAVYGVFLVLSGLALLLAKHLPAEVWDEVDD